MTRLVFDQAFGVDADNLRDVVVALSERLRAHPRLRSPLVRIVGNRWHEFESDLTHFLVALLGRTGDQGGGLLTLYEAFPGLAPEHIADARELFLETALAVLPLHAAASLSNLPTAFATWSCAPYVRRAEKERRRRCFTGSARRTTCFG